MSDALRRAVRTALQAFLGNLVASGVLSAAQESGVVDWSAAKKAVMAAAASGVIGMVSFVMNVLEDNTPTPALLKAPPSSAANPVPDPSPYDPGAALAELVRRIDALEEAAKPKRTGRKATKKAVPHG